MSTANLLNDSFDSDEDDGDFDAHVVQEGDDAADADGDAENGSVDGKEPERDANAGAARAGVVDDDDNDDDDDDDDEDDDEDDEGDDEDEEMPQRKRRRKPTNAFIDIEAVVDEDEEEEEEDEEDGFVEDDANVPEADLRDYGREDHRHRELDRQNEQNQAEDMEALATAFKERHGRSNRRRGPESGMLPRRLLLPSVSDPNIWGVKCRPGKEREVVFSIMKRIEDHENSKKPLPILCAFERGSMMAGYVYVEAWKWNDVLESLNGVANVYPRGPKVLVGLKETPDLLHVVKSAEITPGTWVRFKRGKYQGDLAQVENVLASGLGVRVKAVPRLEYGASANSLDEPMGPGAPKRKRNNFNKANTVAGRPPQRYFSENDARRYHSKYLAPGTSNKKGPNCFTYMGEEYEDGYLVKDVKLNLISTENVNPSLEEVAKFASRVEEGEQTTLDLNALAHSLRNSVSTYQVGDTVEIYDGEQKGCVGKAEMVQGDIVTMKITEGDLKGQTLDVPFKNLRKRFKEGDHVKVVSGKYVDEAGMVVRIRDDKVTLVKDNSQDEITVFSKDVKEATDTGGFASTGKYDLYDLVQLDMTTVGCVIKVDRESLRVLDQNGNARMVMQSQIADKITNRRNAVATDRNGQEIRVGDTVKEIAGETRTGTVLHIYRAFVFLHNRELKENAGVFVNRANSVATIVAKGGRIQTSQSTGPDLEKMNPALQRPGANAAMPPPPRIGGKDRTVGQTVKVRAGPYKSLLGIVKDATDLTARVELHTKSKTITIEKSKLGFVDTITGNIKSFQEFVRPAGRGDGGPPGGFPGGSRTPAWNGGSRTPRVDYMSGSRTPMQSWNSGSHTPAWMAGGDGGRTPAYNAGNKTPAWGDGSRSVYAGNKTPAWNPSSRTPHVDYSERTAWDAGSKTPARAAPSFDGWGGASEHASTARTPGGAGYSAASPDFSSHAYGSAPTPGNPISAPTPSAPTPGPISAPTPGSGYNSWDSAPTPGATGSYGRDPRGGGAAYPSTPGVWAGDDDEAPRYAPATP